MDVPHRGLEHRRKTEIRHDIKRVTSQDFNPSNAGATFVHGRKLQKNLKTLSCWYSFDSSLYGCFNDNVLQIYLL